MQVAATFIEYLVVGCLTLLWILPLIPNTEKLFSKDSGYLAFLLLPAAYVLGMLVDFISKVVVDLIRKITSRIVENLREGGFKALFLKTVWDFIKSVWGIISEPKKRILQFFDEFDQQHHHFSELNFIVLYSTDLGKEYQSRSSRDRIARGAFLNVLIFFGLVVSGLYTLPASFVSEFSWLGINIALFLLVILTYAMWRRFHNLSSRFKRNSVREIREKLKREAKNK